MKNNKKGFTLIELIVVLAILAVIAAIAVPTAFGAITDAQIAADTASVEGFNSAIRMQGTILRASKDFEDSPSNSYVAAFIAAQIKPDTMKPQSNGKIGVTWVAPTTNSIGYFKVTTPGTNVASAETWEDILKAAVGSGATKNKIITNIK
ncbi:MAG: prepilin-type N-terminal cleavage/methylation domain-containing protein [Oscillospiraceae bacterium]